MFPGIVLGVSYLLYIILNTNNYSNSLIKSLKTAGTNCTVRIHQAANEIKDKFIMTTDNRLTQYLWAQTGCLSVVGGVIQWGLSVGLPHANTCYVKKLHPSDPAHTQPSGRQTRHLFNGIFEDWTLLRCRFYTFVCCADLIHELHRKSVSIVHRWMVRLKRDHDVDALFWGNSALYWHHTEHTQPAVISRSCGIQGQVSLYRYHISFNI